MKINFTNVAFALLLPILFISCGDSKKEKIEDVTVKPKTISLKGDLKDYYEIVDRDYIIKTEEDSYNNQGMITVEIKRNEKDFDFKTDNINPFGTNGSEDYHVGFGIEIFDESGPSVIKSATQGGMGGVYSSDDVKGLIHLGKGESGYIRWTVSGDKMKGLINFQITSALKKEDHSNDSISSYDDTSTSDKIKSNLTDSNEKVDKALDSYEAYVDQYIIFLKKAHNGDNSAMAEYPSLMQKAAKMQENMDDMKDEFSGKQMARMMKIQTKLTNAALEMQ
jgi:hypothetical protein